jgi:putative ABC transport system permease protein
MLRDLLSQAYEAMLHNRRRTLITMIGMAWGIATVVLLMAYGAGFGRAIEAIFAQFGTNIMGVFPGNHEPAGRGQEGWCPGETPACRHRSASRSDVPGLLHIAPEVSKDVTVQNDTHSYTWSVSGSYPGGRRHT